VSSGASAQPEPAQAEDPAETPEAAPETAGAEETPATEGPPAGEEDQGVVADTTQVESEATRDERRRIAHQAAIETTRPRPPGEEVEPPPPPHWVRRLEIGGAYAMVFRPFANGLEDSAIGYEPAYVAWALHLHWDLFPWLRLHPYFLDAHHGLDIPAGGLATGTGNSISADATIAEATVATFVFGAKLAPTWPISDRFRAWRRGSVGDATSFPS
jgi:hypothetical protein